MAIILGIDPGSHKTGYGIIESIGQNQRCLTFGVLQLNDKWPLAGRMRQLSEGLSNLIREYQPDEMAIENVFLGKNADSAFKLGHARGVCLLEAAKSGMNVAEYATRHVKKVLTGSGAAEKEQVQFMVERLLSVRSNSLDATDALALAVCHAREVEVKERFASQNFPFEV